MKFDIWTPLSWVFQKILHAFCADGIIDFLIEEDHFLIVVLT